MAGRLNVFQRTMLLWNELHPYNAVHVVEVPSVLQIERLQEIVAKTIEYHKLTGLKIDSEAGTYHYHGGEFEQRIATVSNEGEPTGALKNEIRKQLNRKFDLGDKATPFRFFALPMESSFFLGVSYFHAVAGAESIVLLMQSVVGSYIENNGKTLPLPMDIYPPTYRGWLCRHPGVLFRKLLNLPSLILKLKDSMRLRYKDEMDVENGFELFSLTSLQLNMLLLASKSWGITLNDLFLALLLKVFEPLREHRVYSSRRRQFSVGTIVNLRRDMEVDSHKTFGLFLGSFVVTHEVPEDISLRSLATDVREQTKVIKKQRRYMGSSIDLLSAQRSLRFLNMERKKKFYQKHYPLWGGITNMNLNSIWSQTDEANPVDYMRAVSTGPATPLVLSITTVRDIVNIGMSYRTTVFSEADIEFIRTRFLELVQQIQEEA